MGKALFIAEKPSVAQEFAKALKVNTTRKDGFLESDTAIVTWCVGHLVTMSYPEVYDEKYKKWSLATLPFLPEKFLYEVIPQVEKQFKIVSSLLNRPDVDTIYVCTDSGREGEYIYRLVDQLAQVPESKEKRRVWIDSQTEEEILRGIKEAKLLSEYDNLSSAAYLRAKEDYLMGINFSRVLTLKYGNTVTNYLKSQKWSAISVGRVMTCVLGMVVRREREIRAFVKTPFYRVLASFEAAGKSFDGEWRAVEGSYYFQTPLLYKENGFKERKTAEKFIEEITYPIDLKRITAVEGQNTNPTAVEGQPASQAAIEGRPANQIPSEQQAEIYPKAVVEKIEKKKENKNPPLLFNLAELQNECSKWFKISPDETLKIVQELYEKKLVTYPRTDARVLSTAVSKEIQKNIGGLRNYPLVKEYANEILNKGTYKNLEKTRYVNDKQITDHYAIIPTGQGFGALSSVSATGQKVYEVIVRRFLSIFYPPAVYQKVAITAKMNYDSEMIEKQKGLEGKEERFFASFKILIDEGYFKVTEYSFKKKGKKNNNRQEEQNQDNTKDSGEQETVDKDFVEQIGKLRKGDILPVKAMNIKEGETSPPKRYNSGSMILAMENAGQLIEDEELRAQIKGSGIGTSATRAEILNKLVKIEYLKLNKKTQMITPTLLGELIFDVVNASIRPLLNPELTASWEKGLTYVAEGTITEQEYMDKLEGFVGRRVEVVKQLNNQTMLYRSFDEAAKFYK